MDNGQEVIIAGAGLSGAVAALCLQRMGINVTVLEKSNAPRWKIGETLPPEANRLVDVLGLKTGFDGGMHTQSHGVLSTWGGPSLIATDFIFNPHGCGWQLDRVALESACIQAAERAGARLVRGATVRKLSRTGGRWHVETRAERLAGAWMIDATGRVASVARNLGIKQVTIDRLVSVYLRTSNSSRADLDSRALIEAAPNGWWYTALTPSGRRTVAFQTDVDLLRGAEWQSSEWFMNELHRTQSVGPLLLSHGYEFDFPTALESARSCRLQQFCGPGWLAVGDAAMAIDPLSGQGMLKAIEGGKSAADTLIAGGEFALQRYAKEMESSWRSYVHTWTANYATEDRWPDAPFWSRRRRGLPV